MKRTLILFIMGVSGSGKSTIGQLLAEELNLKFYDGDDFHPPENVKKMAKGLPLDDNDRQGWLHRLNELAKDNKGTGAIIACSALKHDYRKQLRAGIEDQIEFIFLKGSFDLIAERLSKRKGHFMPPELLKSQFEALEIPTSAKIISIDDSPEEIVKNIKKQLDGRLKKGL